MRILYTLNSGQPGGMERHVVDLVSQMVKRGHTVYVWCNQGEIVDWYKEAGAQVFTKRVNVTFGIDIDPIYIFSLVKFLISKKIQIIHAHELRAVANSLLAAFFARTPVRISIIHTPFSEWPISKIKKRIYSLCYKFAIELFATKEIALTKSRLLVKRTEGISEEKLALISNGVDVSKFNASGVERVQYKKQMAKKYGFSANSKIIGNVSRLTEEKGHEYLIRGFAELLPRSNVMELKPHLLIAGGGELEQELRELVEQLSLEKFVTITGRFSDDDITKLYASFDYFVFPSLAEGFGLVLVEAMSAGLPIICSDLAVLREVGDNGVYKYFQPKHSGAIADALDHLLTEKNLRPYQEQALNIVSEKYSISIFGDNYEDLYKELLDPKKDVKKSKKESTDL